MEPAKVTCAKCQGEMQQGSVPMFPMYAFGNYWYAVRFKGTRRLALSPGYRRVIYTYRCASCGYLERYAN